MRIVLSCVVKMVSSFKLIICLLKLASCLSPDLFSKGIFFLSDFSHDLAYFQSTNC